VSLRFESTVPNKNVDQMTYTLIQNMDLLDKLAMHVQSETIQYKVESDATICTKGQCLHVNLSVQQCIQTGLVGGMPQPHVKIFLEERAPLPPRRPLGRNRRHHHLRPRHRERRHPQHSRQLVWTNRNRSRTIRRFRAGGVL